MPSSKCCSAAKYLRLLAHEVRVDVRQREGAGGRRGGARDVKHHARHARRLALSTAQVVAGAHEPARGSTCSRSDRGLADDAGERDLLLWANIVCQRPGGWCCRRSPCTVIRRGKRWRRASPRPHCPWCGSVGGDGRGGARASALVAGAIGRQSKSVGAPPLLLRRLQCQSLVRAPTTRRRCPCHSSLSLAHGAWRRARRTRPCTSHSAPAGAARDDRGGAGVRGAVARVTPGPPRMGGRARSSRPRSRPVAPLRTCRCSRAHRRP